MSVFVQVAIDWIQLGTLYMLIAVGLSLVFSVMRIVNFAHAQFYMVGSFVVYVLCNDQHVNFAAAVVVAALAAAVGGVVLERLVIRPVQFDESRAMIATLGALLAIEGMALVIFGETNRYIPEPIAGGTWIAGSFVDWNKISAAAVAIAAVLALVAALKWTKLGLAMRAIAQNEAGARLQGIRPGPVRSLGFAMGTGLAGLAGGLILPLTGVTPSVGDPILLKMFIILILGGLGSIAGAAAGSFVLALIETVGVTYLGHYSILAAYLLVILVILVRPQGLLGHVETAS